MSFRQHCNACGRETNHVELSFSEKELVQVYDEDAGWAVTWCDRYVTVACSGCDSISFRYTATEQGDGAPSLVRLYPPVRLRRRPLWLTEIPADMARLLRQTYHSLDAGHGAHSLMGARAVADVLLKDKVGDTGSFKARLERLVRDGHVSQKNADVLDAALDAGNAAAHRGYEPSPEDLNAVMDILENLLQAAYHLEGLATRLRGKTPARPRRPA